MKYNSTDSRTCISMSSISVMSSNSDCFLSTTANSLSDATENSQLLCANVSCPYQIKFEEYLSESCSEMKYENEESGEEFLICKNNTCPYNLLYEKLETENDKTESSEYDTKSDLCIMDSKEEICANNECVYKTDDQGSTKNSDLPENSPYWTKSGQRVLDPVTEKCSSNQNYIDLLQAQCSISTCPYKPKNVDGRLDTVANICSNEENQLGIENVESSSGAISSVKLDGSTTKGQTYKLEAFVQCSDSIFIVEENQDKILPRLSAHREELHPIRIKNTPCVINTCKFNKRHKTTTCMPFKDICIFAEEFIDLIILDATDGVIEKLNEIQSEHHKVGKHLQKHKLNEIRAIQDVIENKKNNFSWPTIEDFTIPLGAQRITEYIACCDVKEQWLCGIYYKTMTEEPISHFYHYEVMCGLPTPMYPVAQAIASIYFRIEVSKVVPKCCPIHVTFQLETNRYVYDAAITTIDEKWLLNILRSKIAVYRCFDY